MTSPMLQYIPLTSAYLCQDCDCVGNSATHCPACASTALLGLACVLNRDESQAGSHHHPRRADSQPEEHLLRDSPRQADGGQRRVGVGQEFAGLRHHLRRGAAALCRVALAYARQFLERIEKPDVDEIDGLAPAIAIKQKNSTRNPRSTVATATEIYDYLRLLYARCGTVHCVHCDGLVKRDSIDEIAEATLALGEGTRLNVRFSRCATPSPRRKPKPSPAKPVKAANPRQSRQSQARLNGGESPLTETLKARLTSCAPPASTGSISRAASSSSPRPSRCSIWTSRCPSLSFWTASSSAPTIAPALSMPRRLPIARPARSSSKNFRAMRTAAPRHRFSGAYECKSCHRPGREPEPRLFSFNNPFGACPRCQGFGNTWTST
jgi:excinuclease ABC subunit A